MLRNIRAFVVTCVTLLRPRRRWARFSLLSLLLAVTAACVWLGIITERARDQLSLVKAIRDAGGVVSFTYQTNELGNPLPEDEWSEPSLLVRWFGDGYAHVDYASVPRGLKLSNKEFNALCRCTELRWLSWAAPGLRDEQMLGFRGMTRMRDLYVNSPLITDEGLAALSGMSELESLRLHGAGLTISWPDSPPAVRLAP